MTYRQIQEHIIETYRVTIREHSDCWYRMHAHVKDRTICKWRPKNSARCTFDLLHEVGHIETTTSKMRRCEAEYYATVWAIERCKEYGMSVPESVRKAYQEYIYRELDRGIRRGGTGYNKDFRLVWEDGNIYGQGQFNGTKMMKYLKVRL